MEITIYDAILRNKLKVFDTSTRAAELTDDLLKLFATPSDISEDIMHTIEIDKTRNKLFAKKNNVHLIPPTKAALEEHVKRAAYQEGRVWGQTLLPAPELPPQTSWGWAKNKEGMYEPHWTGQPQPAHTCYELVPCKCKKCYVKRCKCKKAALESTAGVGSSEHRLIPIKLSDRHFVKWPPWASEKKFAKCTIGLLCRPIIGNNCNASLMKNTLHSHYVRFMPFLCIRIFQ